MQLNLFADNIVIENRGELFVSSIIIAENVDYEHRAVIQLINTYRENFDDLRPLHLKCIGTNGTSSFKTWYELDENQVTFLLQLMKNNVETVKFKLSLTKAFSFMKQKIQQKTLSLPQTYLEALKALTIEVENRQQLEKKVNLLTHASKLYTTSEIAKEIGLKSATALNSKLNDDGVQYKQNGTWLMYSKYSERGYVSIKQQVLDSGKIIYDRKWTGVGRDFILNKYSLEVKNEKII